LEKLVWTSEMLIAGWEGVAVCRDPDVGGLCMGNVIGSMVTTVALIST
jgi:hypothetical protein